MAAAAFGTQVNRSNYPDTLILDSLCAEMSANTDRITNLTFNPQKMLLYSQDGDNWRLPVLVSLFHIFYALPTVEPVHLVNPNPNSIDITHSLTRVVRPHPPKHLRRRKRQTSSASPAEYSSSPRRARLHQAPPRQSSLSPQPPPPPSPWDRQSCYGPKRCMWRSCLWRDYTWPRRSGYPPPSPAPKASNAAGRSSS